MHARTKKARVPEKRDAHGTLPRKGSVPGARLFCRRISHEVCAPMNGRAFAYVRKQLSKSACARVFRVRARRFASVRRHITFANAKSFVLKVLLQVEGHFVENTQIRRAPGTCSHFGECSVRVLCVGMCAVLWCACAVLYGFMKCKSLCISSLICVSYLENNFSNCPVSWRKPVGVAEVRTLNPCHMVRKDTNSKSK